MTNKGDLISRSALKKEFGYTDEWYKSRTVATIIDNAPTVDTTCPNCDSGYAQGYSDGYLKGKEERPIDDLSEYSDKLWQKAYERGKAEARPTGEWIDEGQYAEGHSEHYYRCSECGGHIIELRVDDFCKCCGADMRKEADNGTSLS